MVAPASYSEWAQEVATKGYDVYIVHFPLNLAVLAPNAAEQIIKDHPQQNFVLAGHSLGGVMASRFVAENEQRIKGMIYLASYPDEKGALNKQDLPVLSITATNDGVLNWTSYQKPNSSCRKIRSMYLSKVVTMQGLVITVSKKETTKRQFLTSNSK